MRSSISAKSASSARAPTASPGAPAFAIPSMTRRLAMEVPLADQALVDLRRLWLPLRPGRLLPSHLRSRQRRLPACLCQRLRLAPTATAADALSTACYLMPIDALAAALRAAGAARAVVVLPTGQTRIVEA